MSAGRQQVVAYLILSLVVFACVALLARTQGALFVPYFGKLRPLLAMGLVIVAGGAALALLQARGWFSVIVPERTWQGVALGAKLAAGLGVAIALVDVALRFHQDINAPLPQALIFYPAIGFVAEMVFHIVPLTLLLLVLSPWVGDRDPQRLIWLCIVLVALIEPTFQVVFGARAGDPWLANAYVGLHVFAISLGQLYLLKRYDFMAAFSMRMAYYAFWHVVWGYLRLRWLF